MEPQPVVTLTSLADGAALELFQSALKTVLENIQDPNTAHQAKRGIKLDFAFVADEDRNVGAVEVTCSTKLAGVKGVKTVVFFGRQEGALVAVEQPRQSDLFPKPARKPLAAVGAVKE